MEVKIDHQDGFITAKFPYNEELLKVARNLSVRTFDWERMVWKIGLSELDKFVKNVESLGHQVVYTDNYNLLYRKTIDLSSYTHLYDYQKKGADFLLSQPSTLLGDDVGTGKTVTTLTSIKALGEGKKNLIIVPVTLISTWLVENEKFTQLPIQVVRGTKAKRMEQWKVDSKIFLTNYEVVRNDDIPLNWDWVILDEASRIRNSFTKLRRKLGLLTAKRKTGLTSSPIENSINDLYSIVTWLTPGLLPPYHIFEETFFVRQLKQMGGRVFWETTGYKNLEKLKEMIHPIFLRREKRDVGRYLPPLTKQTIWCRLNKEERDTIRVLENEIKELTDKGKSHLGIITTMRVYCSQLDEKINEAYEIVRGTNEQIIVFSEFHDAINKLTKRLIDSGVSVDTLTGERPQAQRKDIIENFQGGLTRVLICQTKVGGYGLNLQNASVAIFLNRPYTIATEDQAIGRIEREGQKNNMTIYYILSHNTFEERVNKILEEKKELTDAVVTKSIVGGV